MSAVVAAVLASCTVLNDPSEICEVSPDETLINQAGDGVEYIGHPDGAIVLEDGRLLVAFGSSTEEGAESEVRVSIVEPETESRIYMCNSDSTELVVSAPIESDPEQPSYRPVAAPVPFILRGRGQAVAAVGWSVGTPASPDATIQLRYLDEAGCRVGDEIIPLTNVPPPITHLSLAWSVPRQELLAVFRDGSRVWGAWFPEEGVTANTWVLADDPRVQGGPVVALGPEGDGIVAWVRYDVEGIDEWEFVVRAVLIDTDGQPREAVLAAGTAAPFTVATHQDEHAGPIGLAVAATTDRYAVVSEGAEAVGGTDRVWLRELDALDGNPLRWESAPDGEAGRIDPEDDEYQGSPSARYLPDGSLLVLWESDGRDGTGGRLLDVDGRPRFNAITCDESVFTVGARGGQLPGPAAPLVVGDHLWIFHAADPPEDPLGTGVMGWRLPISELWPGRPSRD